MKKNVFNKIIILLFGFILTTSLTSCVATYAASQDDTYMYDEYENEIRVSNVDINLILSVGTPVYYRNELIYIIYNGLYYYPFYYDNYWYIRAYLHPFRNYYRPHFRPHRYDRHVPYHHMYSRVHRPHHGDRTHGNRPHENRPHNQGNNHHGNVGKPHQGGSHTPNTRGVNPNRSNQRIDRQNPGNVRPRVISPSRTNTQPQRVQQQNRFPAPRTNNSAPVMRTSPSSGSRSVSAPTRSMGGGHSGGSHSGGRHFGGRR